MNRDPLTGIVTAIFIALLVVVVGALCDCTARTFLPSAIIGER